MQFVADIREYFQWFNHRDELLQRQSAGRDELWRDGFAFTNGELALATDVEGEINGLLTDDRAVTKIPAKQLAKWHRQLVE